MKKISIFAIMLVCFLALTGCSSSSSNNNSKDNSSTSLIPDLKNSQGETLYHYETVDKEKIMYDEDYKEFLKACGEEVVDGEIPKGTLTVEFTEKDGYISKFRTINEETFEEALFSSKEDAERIVKENKDNVHKGNGVGYKFYTLVSDKTVIRVWENDLEEMKKNNNYDGLVIPNEAENDSIEFNDDNTYSYNASKLIESFKDAKKWEGYILKKTK